LPFGLAMDAFSVSIAYGITTKNYGKTNAIKMASSFGAFQMGMPILGWLAGVEILNLIAGFDHWLAFGLLLIIGCKMIYEAAKPKQKREGEKAEPRHAFAFVGCHKHRRPSRWLSFAFLKVPIATQ